MTLIIHANKVYELKAGTTRIHRSIDSFPIGVSADSCPLNGPRQRHHLIRAQLVYLDFSPQTGVINKIYNLLHHVLG